jgi:hypothetical protein
MTDDEKEQLREIAAHAAHRLVDELENDKNDPAAVTVIAHFKALLCGIAPLMANRIESDFYDASLELITEIIVEKQFGPNWRLKKYGDPWDSVDLDALEKLSQDLYESGKIEWEQRGVLNIAVTSIIVTNHGIDLERLKACLDIIFEKKLEYSREVIECAYDLYLNDNDVESITRNSIKEALARLGIGEN